MRFKKTLIFSLLLSILSTSNLFTVLKVDGEVSAKSAILINAKTGTVLYEKNSHTPTFPASTTKIITAIYALEQKGKMLDTPVIASQEAVGIVPIAVRRSPTSKHPPYRLEYGGTHMGIQVGEILSLRTLLYGLMLHSANDAANVIGEYVSGSMEAFMDELNEYVQKLGCHETTLHTPHGLPHAKHTTTAYDFAKITQHALQNPTFCTIVKTIKYQREKTNKQPESLLVQHNALLRPGKFYYPKAIGVKTGYTVAGGHCIVAAAEDENRSLIAVILGCEQAAERYKDAILLFDTAFKEPKISRTLFSHRFEKFSKALAGGKNPLEAHLGADLILSYYPSEEPTFTTQIFWKPPPFPIPTDSHVGEVAVISSDGAILASAPLIASAPIESTWRFKLESLGNKAMAWMKHYRAILLGMLGLSLVGATFYFFHHRKMEKKATDS